MNDFTISSPATALSMSNTVRTATSHIQVATKEPISSQYSVVQRRDSDVSTSHSEDDERKGEDEGQFAADEPIVSQYSVVTHENMDHVSEASDSEDGNTSDAEAAQDTSGDAVHKDKESDFNQDTLSETQDDRPSGLYENIVYN